MSKLLLIAISGKKACVGVARRVGGATDRPAQVRYVSQSETACVAQSPRRREKRRRRPASPAWRVCGESQFDASRSSQSSGELPPRGSHASPATGSPTFPPGHGVDLAKVACLDTISQQFHWEIHRYVAHEQAARTDGRLAAVSKTAAKGMRFTVEIDREDDGRWIAEVMDIPGAMAYGPTRREALASAEALALRVLADRLEHGEAPAEQFTVAFEAPAA